MKRMTEHYESAEKLLTRADNIARNGMARDDGPVVTGLAHLAEAHLTAAIALRDGLADALLRRTILVIVKADTREFVEIEVCDTEQELSDAHASIRDGYTCEVFEIGERTSGE